MIPHKNGQGEPVLRTEAQIIISVEIGDFRELYYVCRRTAVKSAE